jgi:hypothetical protein
MFKQRTAVALPMLMLLASAAAADKKPAISNEGSIGAKWMLADGAKIVPASYPPSLANRKENVCMALGYLIGEDGKTSSFAVLKQWNSTGEAREPVAGYWKALAEAGAAAVSQWRFKPKPGVKVVVPTYTVTTISFRLDPAAADPSIKCRIPDLADHIAGMRAKPFEQGGINRQLQEHERIEQHNQDLREIMRRANGG